MFSEDASRRRVFQIVHDSACHVGSQMPNIFDVAGETQDPPQISGEPRCVFMVDTESRFPRILLPTNRAAHVLFPENQKKISDVYSVGSPQLFVFRPQLNLGVAEYPSDTR
jgi:hypothetical protein